MDIVYIDHACFRMKQRGITSLEVELVLKHPKYVKKSFEGRKVACGEVRQRIIKVVYIETESYKKFITMK